MSRRIGVRNPRTGEVDHVIDVADAASIERIARRLSAAQPAWEALGAPARAETLAAWRERLAASRDSLVDALVQDTGRLVESQMEVDAVLRGIDRWCAMAPGMLAEEPPRPSAIPTITVGQSSRAYPLVAVISPWNFPLLLSHIDAVPALAAGCAVIVKPSEIAPRFVEAVRAAAAEVDALSDVLAYVTGDAETGGALIDNVDAVCFTGSLETGRAVVERAARRFIPAFLELGGKDPALVLASANLDRASSAVLWGGTANAGQSCQSIERVYVEEGVHDRFVALLLAKAQALRLCVPRAESGEIGPIIARRQVDVIAAHLADAVSKGARVQTGGTVETFDGGHYLRPTVLTRADHSMMLMVEETFGPVLPVMAVRDADEAVGLANDSMYGLSAAVFAGTQDEAMAVARRLDAGGVSINDAALTALVHDGEKNSFNLSGLGGSRMGPQALRRFARRQAFLVNGSDAPDPWWYPALRAGPG